MTDTVVEDENAIDSGIDTLIYSCLDLGKPKSFFLYAGAGSGKTRSLVNAIDRLRIEFKRRLLLRGQSIAVITYTNAACDEIKQRLEFDPLVEVSTIHSFAWALIGGFNGDIRAWLRENLKSEIAELEAAAAKGRAGTKAARDRELSIASKRRRIENIESVLRFVYSPTGDNRTRDSLNHSEVISITSDFLRQKPTLQDVLVSQYPVLFIDESQDTNRHLMDAFLEVQQAHKEHFCLGLFGDTMQRIYSDGKAHLADAIPTDWARPAKQMNHRCPQRVIRLINRIRVDVDDQQQKGRTDKPEGVVRLFVVPNLVDNKFHVEAGVAQRMAKITEDESWNIGQQGYKTLILEHHMAARRMGFEAMFEPLYKVGRFGTGLLDGSLPGIRFFAKNVLPVVEAVRRNDPFAVANVVRSQSPLLDDEALKAAGPDQIGQLKKAKLAVDELMRLWANGSEPTFLEVLHRVSETGLFAIPDALQLIVQSGGAEKQHADDEDTDEEMDAWRQSLATPFKQMSPYAEYVRGTSPFGTHQGVKGLEFPRVMVIISDEEARGFLFSYEKLFGAKQKSATDLKHESEGGETTIDRTRRLLYVTCSRAESSLAIVAYSDHPESVREQVIKEGWFDANEVELLPG